MLYRLEGITRRFGGNLLALDGVSLGVERGEHVAFIGPSGAGKTTLFRVLNLTIRPTAGVLRFDGRDVRGLAGGALRELRRGIGTIYQQHNLVGRLRVVHNVLAGNLGRWSTWRALGSLVRPREAARAAEALAQVGIPEKLYARTDELSGGQQQRVAIARVLVQDPAVILADEPVSSVDPSLAEAIVALLRQLSHESRKTLLMNLHSIELALRHFPRIVGVRDGGVVFDRTAGAVTPELLQALYAGHRDEARPFDLPDAAPVTLGNACRPLPGFER